jgi:hypothetical protein
MVQLGGTDKKKKIYNEGDTRGQTKRVGSRITPGTQKT